jgi:hypothetical protein
MRKFLFPMAAVLAWSVALAGLSGFDAVDAGSVAEVATAEMDTAPAKVTGNEAGAEESRSAEEISQAAFDARHVALQKQ